MDKYLIDCNSFGRVSFRERQSVFGSRDPTRSVFSQESNEHAQSELLRMVAVLPFCYSLGSAERTVRSNSESRSINAPLKRIFFWSEGGIGRGDGYT